MKTIAILMGGNSGEYEISLKTAANIFEVLDRSKYIPYLIHIKDDSWDYIDDEKKKYPIDKNDFSLTIGGNTIHFDTVFIAIHGDPGENGKLQGYFEMLRIPYTGCDMFTSALTFNKYFCNMAVKTFGFPVSPSVHFYKDEPVYYEQIEEFCGYPCFVKPCNSGSSVGVTKVADRKEMIDAVALALEYDNQAMVEKFVPGREVTCGVVKLNGEVKAMAVTEILSKKEYYDYEAKYTPGFLELVTPAEIDKELEETILTYSEKIYTRLGCKGVVRIDYIVTPDGVPYFLEVNTIPGQTAMSIIPRQVKYAGLDIKDFYSDLVEESFQK
ncbi:D-alanine--D-alanine ligase [Bacteroidales bacterium OttesenSCG-928-A14]|nr:D-alanine--D-alanine ligase [Bacteroidales bacterium OttesenSCG-928-A14]